ncbi:MAG: PhoH family protein [Candidatus Omnitrophota bacterium]|nr:PhoH family protein [Candidatus Omnitrophota bacterium]
MEKIIRVNSLNQAQGLFGLHDRNAKRLERDLKVSLSLDGENLRINGSFARVKKAANLIQEFLNDFTHNDFRSLEMRDAGNLNKGRKDVQNGLQAAMFNNRRMGFTNKRIIEPKTKGQREYVEAIRKYDIVFGVGPAGTGKTYLAMFAAVKSLKEQQVRRIILTRPAIEAGESLGFLPGDMYEKISPYLRPLYDALYDMIEGDRIEKYIESGIIEVAPLAYMRGRTLNDAFIILDEAQNATQEQMKMFLTRLGFDSKVVITGDITQSDLPGGKPQGLLQALEILKGIEGIKISRFSGLDVVRHELVQKIVQAYEKANRNQ